MPLGFVPIRLASSCASPFRFSPSHSVTVTLLLFRAIPSVFSFAEALATCDLLLDFFLRSTRPPSLPPFFSHGISNFEGSPNQSRSSRPSTLAPPFIGICDPAFLSSLPCPPFLSRALLPSFSFPLPISPSITRPACTSLTPDPFTKYPSSPILDFLAPSSISGPAASALGDPPTPQQHLSCCIW
ncbi:hypothetical protein BJV74DRAFT_327321 [Russula compacta]|nr:hypothetical protein BJV74DRAFT_327321 [Russula compacta]